MGLFDSLTSDPDQQRALMQGLLSGAFGAMAGRGSRLQAWGQGGLAGLMGYQGSLDKSAQAKQQALQNERQALQDQLLRGQIGQQQRQAQIQALPGQFYRAPSMPGVDATGGMDTAMENPANQASPEGRFDMGGYQNALMGLDPIEAVKLKALMAKDETPIKGSPGDVFLDKSGKQLFSVPDRPKQDALPSGMRMGPNGPEWIPGYLEGRERVSRAGAASMTYSAPIPVINPKTGQIELARPDSQGGMKFTGVTPPPQNRDTKAPAEIQRMNIAADTMGKMLDRYDAMLDKYNPRDPLVQANPAVKAEFQSLMKGIQLQFKEVQALGALAGPDLGIMEAAITDPFTFKGAYYGREGLRSQIKQARQLLKERGAAIEKSGGKPEGSKPADNDPLGIR